MKKFIFPMLVLFVLLFSGISVTAQMVAANNQLLVKGERTAFLYEPTSESVPARSYVSIKVMRDFIKSFAHAQAIKWYQTPQGPMAYFVEHGISCRSVYDGKGNWAYTVRYYNEQDLAKAIRLQVKSVWFDYTITRISEITWPEGIVYFVRMEDKTRCVTIRVCEGEEMDETESFLK